MNENEWIYWMNQIINRGDDMNIIESSLTEYCVKKYLKIKSDANTNLYL